MPPLSYTPSAMGTKIKVSGAEGFTDDKEGRFGANLPIVAVR